MKLLITGAASFIGLELIARCKALGIDYVGLDQAEAADTISVDIRDGNLSDIVPEAIDAVIHLAAISRDPDCRRDPVACYDVNVAGTINVFEAAHARGARQFIFASTEWIYDSFEADGTKCEDDPIDSSKLTSDYALSKLTAESALRIRHQETALPVTILRFGIIYGPRRSNWSAVEALLTAVATGGTVTVGARSTARCFIHVSDIVDGILASVGQGGYDIFNLQADAPTSLGEVVDASAKLLGRAPDLIETAPNMPNIRNVSNKKARDRLGWQPKIALASGLRTVAEFLELPGVASDG